MIFKLMSITLHIFWIYLKANIQINVFLLSTKQCSFEYKIYRTKNISSGMVYIDLTPTLGGREVASTRPLAKLKSTSVITV